MTHFIRPRLLLLGNDNDWLDEKATEFDHLGLKTITANAFEAGLIVAQDLEIEVVLIDSDFENSDTVDIDALKESAGARHLPVCGWQRHEAVKSTLNYDLMFYHDSHPQQIVMQIEHIIRLAVAEEEYEVRKKCFPQQFKMHSSHENVPLAVLSVGKPTPDYLVLNNTLSKAGMDLTASITSYSAFDYLHEKSFDCVVLWVSDHPEEALSIAAGMRRNTRLYHTPIILRLNQTIDLDTLNLRGINDISIAHRTADTLCERVMRLANGHRRLHQLRESLINFKDLEGIDAPTQLFGRDLFAQHLSRLSDYSRQRNRPLSVCVLKIVETDAIGFARQKGYLDAALTQIGAMVSRLIRCEDTGGRLSNERFALALPATTFEKARLVCERIAAVISCTAFETKPGLPPYIVEFDVGVAELLRNEPPSEALLRAAENSRHNIHNQRFSAF